nr:recombinase family protein [uncultured Flavobacterium sp.]
MTKVKYIRVSTDEQNTDQQKVNAKDFTKIYKDKVSRAINFRDRKEAKKLIAYAQNGKVNEIHIDSIDILGRNIIDILTIVEFFNSKSVKLFIKNIRYFFHYRK